METKNSKRKLTIACIVLAVLLIAFLAVWFVLKPALQSGSKEITVTITADAHNRSVTFRTDTETLGDALRQEKLVEENDGPYGLYILCADGITADESQQQWWALSKNGEMLATGADSTPIANGETYEITLKTGW